MGIRGKIVTAASLGMVAFDAASSVSAATLPFGYATGNSTIPRVVLEQGVVHGFRDNITNAVYLGIPYAATTGGENRWAHQRSMHQADS